MADNGRDMRREVAAYQKLVLEYEALDEEIDTLIMEYGGASEKMTPEALRKYRRLARRRDEIFSEMRVMEQDLLSDDSGE